jgi:hypothetical protein
LLAREQHDPAAAPPDLQTCPREPCHDRRSDRSTEDRGPEGLSARAIERASARRRDLRRKDGLKELADAGATFIRTGCGNWGPAQLDEQLAAERAQLDAAAAHGLHCWAGVRSVSVANGGFHDWFGPHDVPVYRLGL